MEPVIARKTWRTGEPIHGAIYFCPEAVQEYTSLGLDSRQGYFASRSAAMGPVGAEPVVATFFNFAPAVVHAAIPSAWAVAAPDVLLAARLRAADAMLRRFGGDEIDGPAIAEAAALARVAAEAASARPEGRPLFASHAGLPWPDEPHLVLWHAQTLLREFRGDGHVALLTTEGVDGCAALVVHAATGEVPADVLRTTRAWSDEEWAAAAERVRSRGWLDADGTLTESGRDHRQMVEDRTDALALAAYEPLGDDGCARLRELIRPLSKAVVAGGGLGPLTAGA